MEIGKCTSWIHGKYTNGEINVPYSYIQINGNVTEFGEDIFIQDSQADDAIEEINDIYHSQDITAEEAFNEWINRYF